MQPSTIATQILRIIIAVSTTAVAVSCQKEIKMDIKDTPPVLVANTLAQGGRAWDIEISASQFILDSGSAPLLDDASATITDGSGTVFALTNQGAGHYTLSDMVPEQGETYFVSVSHPDYPPVTARCEIPVRTTITSVEKIGTVKDGYMTFFRLKIRFSDPVGENYYRFRVISTYTSQWYKNESDHSGLPDTTIINSYPINYRFSSASPYKDLKAGCFTDEYFEGSEAAIDIDIDEYYTKDVYDEGTNSYKLTVEVESLSADYYRYLLTYSAYSSNSGPLAQPVQIHSNVTGGLGIIGGHAYSDSVYVPID